MKEIIQALLGKVGYEIRRKNCPSSVLRNTMSGGLHWLKENEISVSTVLDVGASDGRWSKDCMEYYPYAKYVLFEPQPVHSRSLDDFASSSKGRVLPVKEAVGGEDGHLSFDISSPLGGGPATQESKDIMKVKMTTIDSSVTKQNLEGPFLLKLDTHGIEKKILQGAEKTLQNCEILIIEAYNFRITDETLLFWELCDYLDRKGFRPIDVVDLLHRNFDSSFWQMDLIFIRSSWNGYHHISYE